MYRKKISLLVLSILFLMSIGVSETVIQDWNEFDDMRNSKSEDYVLGTDLDENTTGYDSVVEGGFSTISSFSGSLDAYNYTIQGFQGTLFSDSIGEFKNVVLEDVNTSGGLFDNVDSGGDRVRNVDVVNAVADNVLFFNNGFTAGDFHDVHVDNLTIYNNDADYCAAFGIDTENMDVYDVSLSDSNITCSNAEVGGLMAFGEFTAEDTYIENNYLEGQSVGGIYSGKDHTYYSDYELNRTKVSGNNITGSEYAGGIIGQFYHDNGFDLYGYEVLSNNTVNDASKCSDYIGGYILTDETSANNDLELHDSLMMSDLQNCGTTQAGEYINEDWTINDDSYDTEIHRRYEDTLWLTRNAGTSYRKTSINTDNDVTVSNSGSNNYVNDEQFPISGELLTDRDTVDLTYPYSSDTYEDWDFNNTWKDGDHSLVVDHVGNEGYPMLNNLYNPDFEILSVIPKNNTKEYDLNETLFEIETQSGPYDCLSGRVVIQMPDGSYKDKDFPQECEDGTPTFNQTFEPIRYGSYPWAFQLWEDRDSLEDSEEIYQSEKYNLKYEQLTDPYLSIFNPSNNSNITTSTVDFEFVASSKVSGDIKAYSNGNLVFEDFYNSSESDEDVESYNFTDSVDENLVYGSNDLSVEFKRDYDNKTFYENISYRIYVGPEIFFEDIYPNDGESVDSDNAYSSIDINSNVEGTVLFELDGEKKELENNKHYGDGESTYIYDLIDQGTGEYCYKWIFETDDEVKESDERCFFIVDTDEDVIVEFDYIKPPKGSNLTKTYNKFSTEMFSNVAGELELYIDGEEVNGSDSTVTVSEKGVRENYSMDILLSEYDAGSHDYEFRFSHFNGTDATGTVQFDINDNIADIYDIYPEDGSNVVLDKREDSLTHKWTVEKWNDAYKQYEDHAYSRVIAYLNDERIYKDRMRDIERDFSVDIDRNNLTSGSNELEVVYQFEDINNTVLESVSESVSYNLDMENTWYEDLSEIVSFDFLTDELKLLIASFFIVAVGISAGVMAGALVGIASIIVVMFIFMELGFLPTWLFVIASVLVGVLGFYAVK